MFVTIVDKSKGLSHKMNRKILKASLLTSTERVYVGSLPNKVIEQILAHLRGSATRATDIEVYKESKNDPRGIKIIRIGKNKDYG